jgi:aspartate racemase
MHIGLIGGIGPAATDLYYRRLIAAASARGVALDLTMAHADTATLLGHLAAHDVAAQVAIYMRLTERLAAAGAGCVVVTSIAGHFCIGAFKAVSPLPVIDMIEVVGASLATRGLQRVGILGTRTVMASRFYGGVAGVEIIPPAGAALDAVHEAYVAMAAAGVVTAAQRTVFRDASLALLAEGGAEAIMLGGTDLALAFDSADPEFPLVDCAAIHVDAIAARALS